MTNNFTLNLLTKAAYNELSSEEAITFRELMSYPANRELFKDIKTIQRSLDTLKREPSQSSVNIIMDYSASTRLEEIG